MRFLTVRNVSRGRDGRKEAKIIEKLYKYGDVVGMKNVSLTKRYIVMSGKASSGKSRYLVRLHENAEGLWFSQLRPYAHTENRSALASRDDRPAFKQKHSDIGWTFPTPVFILVKSEQAQWLDHPHVAAWWDSQAGNEEQPYKKLKVHHKRTAIVEYLRATRAVLFVDDLDKIPIKKLDFFKQLLGVASRVVVTATTFGQIPQGLRLILNRDEFLLQHLELTTEASFDATHYIMFVVVVLSALSGQWAVAAFASALYAMLNKSKFSTKF